MLQLERKRNGSASEADYLRIITQKTASFISACCRIGALLAKVTEVRDKFSVVELSSVSSGKQVKVKDRVVIR